MNKWICGSCGKEFGKEDIQMLIPDGKTEYEACKTCFEKWQESNMTLNDLIIAYDEIINLKKQLPNSRGKKDFSKVEENIRTKCNSLNIKINVNIQNFSPDETQTAKNLQSGCLKLISNPYARIV